MPDSSATAAYAPPDSAAALVQVLDDYLAALQDGRAPDRADLLAAHPALAGQLESCLSALDFIHKAESPAADAPPTLGDFRIVREVGRGGMGVVYEAEQVSLKRRVALKVLRFGGAADEQALERFRREAETVARLHHTNIVPVFAVGTEGGVPYYAMQFIDGVSLDRAPRSEAEGFRPVVRWGLQAAEALAHAHARGVIHRDIKPANLLLDAEGTVWLTDFGLAKRADEVVLTAAGVLLGTPRYMSPEQASHVKKPVDHRSDIYSLGATLYELVTGRPVFEADTPQKVIAQILDREPAAPRRVRPDLPRDLDTVLLKCLAKDPARRYPSAAALADDLRAVLDGRPVKARRPSLRERAVRWVRKQRRALALAGVTAVAAALLALGGVSLRQEYAERRLGQLLLTTDGPHLTAEVLDGHDRPAAPPFTVPTADWLSLPEGDYRVRLSRPGVLSETLRLAVTRGTQHQYKVAIGGREMFPPTPVDRWDTFEFVNLSGATDLVLLERQRGIRRLAAGSGAPVWEVLWGVGQRGEPLGSQAYGLTGDALALLRSNPTFLVRPAPDVNGDGTRDLVWAGPHGLLAMSGTNGTKLWFHPWQPRLPDPAPDRKLRSYYNNGGYVNRAVGRPVVLDVNGDKRPDLIAVVSSTGQVFVADGPRPQKQYTSRPQSWVEAVSGKTGQTLWRFDLSSAPVQGGPALLSAPRLVPRKGAPPLLLLQDGPRVVGLDPRTGRPAWPAHDLGGVPTLAGDTETQPLGFPRSTAPPGRQLLDLDGDGVPDVLLALVGRRLAAVDLGTGKPVWPARDLPAVPLRPPQLLPGKTPALLAVFPHAGDAEYLDVAAFDWATGRERWRKAVRASWPPARKKFDWDMPAPAPDWPVVADVGGRSVVVPSQPPRTRPKPPADPNTIHIDFDERSQNWAGLEVIDAATGESRWTRKLPVDMSGRAPQIDHFVVGPDIDGDGVPDLFAASFGQPFVGDPGVDCPTHHFLFVTALSGRDGHTLWWWREKTRRAGQVGALRWWQPGPDGHPLLLVAFNSDDTSSGPKSPSATYLLTASSGRLAHTLAGVAKPELADLDGDGILDLYAVVWPAGGHRSEQKPTLFTNRGTPAEAWRRLGKWEPTQDLDGDGVADAVSSDGKATVAVSGRDGHELWRGPAVGGPFVSLPPPLGDLDGDGVPDLIRSSVLGRAAISGRTGRPLWPAKKEPDADLKVEGTIGISHWSGLPAPTVLDLRGDGRPTILYAYTLDFGDMAITKMNQRRSQLWLAAVDGRSNEVLWKRPLDERDGRRAEFLFLAGTADLDDDGRPEVVVLVSRGKSYAVLALRGHDGSTLWEHALTQPGDLSSFHDRRFPIALLAAPDRPDAPAVFVLERQFDVLERKEIETGASDKRQFRIGPSCYRVQGLRARDGKPQWEYRFQHEPARTLHMGSATSVPWNHQAVLARLPQIGPAVCLYTVQDEELRQPRRKAQARLIVLDRQGRERQKQTFAIRQSWSSGITIGGLAAHDLDGDGFDELLWVACPEGHQENRLYATRGGFDRQGLLWEQPSDRSDPFARFLPGGKGRGSALLLYDRQLGVSAVDGRTGRTLSTFGRIELPPALPPGTAARILVPVADSTACRLLPGGPPEPPARAITTPVPDPRLRIDLPWTGGVGFYLKSALFGLVLLAVPALLLVVTVRRRSWRWALGLLAYVGLVVGASLAGWLSIGGSFADLFQMLAALSWLDPLLAPLGWLGIKLNNTWFRAVLGLPLAVVGLAAAWWLVRRRWRRLALLVVVVALLAAGAGAWMLAADKRRYDPAQYYDWSDWYLVLGHGVYYAGLLLLALGLLASLVKAAAWLVRRVRTRRLRGSQPATAGA